MSWPSRNGELALTASSSGRTGRRRSQTAHRAIGAAHADVDVQRERVVAPRDVAQALDDAAVVRRCRCCAARGSRPTDACRSSRARRRGWPASVNSRRRRSRWWAIASCRSSPRPETISISEEISSPVIASMQDRVELGRRVAQLLEARDEVERPRGRAPRTPPPGPRSGPWTRRTSPPCCRGRWAWCNLRQEAARRRGASTSGRSTARTADRPPATTCGRSPPAAPAAAPRSS